jgi:hypothetical protein
MSSLIDQISRLIGFHLVDSDFTLLIQISPGEIFNCEIFNWVIVFTEGHSSVL